VENVGALEHPLQHEEEQIQELRHMHLLQYCTTMDNMFVQINIPLLRRASQKGL
jgi:hypothetical protein